MCRVVDTLLLDQEMVYAPREGNDRLLLGLKGSLNEYELDLLRARSVAARHAKARRGELVVAAPVGFLKTEDQRLEKDPDRRVQEAVLSIFRKFREIGSVRQTLLWFLEEGLLLPARQADGRTQPARVCDDTAIAGILNRNGLRTGRGNGLSRCGRWTGPVRSSGATGWR